MAQIGLIIKLNSANSADSQTLFITVISQTCCSKWKNV